MRVKRRWLYRPPSMLFRLLRYTPHAVACLLLGFVLLVVGGPVLYWTGSAYASWRVRNGSDSERGAATILRSIQLAQVAYCARHENPAEDLTTLAAAGLIDPDLASGRASGYRFRLAFASTSAGIDEDEWSAPHGFTWTVVAEPERSGELHFALQGGWLYVGSEPVGDVRTGAIRRGALVLRR